MGFFDLPAPLFDWIDARLAGALPEAPRLILWGVVGAALSMLLYWALSPQAAIQRTRGKVAAARAALNAYDGEFTGAGPLIRDMLRLSLKQLGLVTGPAVLASLPVLFLIVWVSTAYGYRFPDPVGEAAIRVVPEGLQARWADTTAAGEAPRIVVSDAAGRPVEEVALKAPVPVLHKRQWWNLLLGNPAGYLPEPGIVEYIELALPVRQYIPVGPDWLRGWEAVLFGTILVASLAIKLAFRIA
jgi:hypothetical protein